MSEIVPATQELLPQEQQAPAIPGTLFRTSDPAEVVTKVSEIAKVLADVIRRQGLFEKIGPKEYVRVEGWTLLGSMLGVVPVCTWTRQIDGGWEARVEARTLDGRIVGAAEAMCLRSEAHWRRQDEFALRSMAQTRATAKALRQPLGFVIQLAGFASTPAEEITAEMRSARSERPAKKAADSAKNKDAQELGERLRELVYELGATASLDLVDRKVAEGDVAWIKRQIATAERALERNLQEKK